MSETRQHRDGQGSRHDGYPAEKARQGRIVLRSRTQRAIFIAGLVGFVLLVLAVGIGT